MKPGKTSLKYLWWVINTGLAVASLFAGYNSMQPAQLSHENPDLIFCIATLVTTSLAPLGGVAYAVKRYGAYSSFRRPSWGRSPLNPNFWEDPLQSLFITTMMMLATAIGASIWWPAFGSVGFWTVSFYFCFVLGLAVGQLLVYRIYRKRITSV